VVRIKERRTVYSDILAYFFDRKTSSAEEDYGIFRKTIKPDITKHIIEIFKRLTKNECPPGCSSSNNNNNNTIIENIATETQSSTSNISMKEKLQLVLEEKSKQALELENKITHEPRDVARIVRRENLFFEEEGIKGKYLTMVFASLKSIRIPNRAFSTAGMFGTKIRSRLGDKTLDILCFLNAYFAKK